MQFIIAGVAALLLPTTACVDAFETCSDLDNQVLVDLYSAGAMTDACAPYAEFMPIGNAAVYWPCDATDCNAVMAQVASDMPDCWYMGNNQKEMLQDAVNSCDGEASPEEDTTEAPVQDSTSTASTFAGTALYLSSISLLIVFL